jgi:hypothetical protein
MEQAFVFRVQLGAYRRDQPVHQLRCHFLRLVVQVTLNIPLNGGGDSSSSRSDYTGEFSTG